MTWSASTLAGMTALMGIFHGAVHSLRNDGQHVMEKSEENLQFDIRLQSSIRDSLLSNSIIPDVLDDFMPTHSLDLTYPPAHESVALGNTLSVPSVETPPVYQFRSLLPAPPPGPTPPGDKKFYTLVFTDPDAKSRSNPKWSEFCHWIVANVSSPDISMKTDSCVSSSGPWTRKCSDDAREVWAFPTLNVLESYYAPAPPKRTGFHRYVFVLLEGDVTESWKLHAPSERKHWGYGKPRHGVRDWAAEYGLQAVGANFFYAQSEESGV